MAERNRKVHKGTERLDREAHKAQRGPREAREGMRQARCDAHTCMRM